MKQVMHFCGSCKLKVLFLLLLATVAVACKHPDLGDAENPIRFVKILEAGEFEKTWQTKDNQRTKIFNPLFIDPTLYDFTGVQIVFATANFKSADAAFGFHAALVSEPREIFDNAAWYKPPFVAALSGNTVEFAFSPNQPSFYSPFIKNEVLLRLGKTKNLNLSWHKDILPENNQFQNSIFYLPQKEIQLVPLYHIYGAKYQSKNNTARLYVAKFAGKDTAKNSTAQILRTLAQKKIRLTAYPGRMGLLDRGSWWRNLTGGTDAILTYHQLVLYFENFADEWAIDQKIQECFNRMRPLRDIARGEGR